MLNGNSILSLYFLSFPLSFSQPSISPIVTNYKAPVCKIQVRAENLEFLEFGASLGHIASSRTASTIERDPVSIPITPLHTLIYIFQ